MWRLERMLSLGNFAARHRIPVGGIFLAFLKARLNRMGHLIAVVFSFYCRMQRLFRCLTLRLLFTDARGVSFGS